MRVRTSGPVMFIDLHILVKPDEHLEDVHRIMDNVEAAVRRLTPKADVTVHPEPWDQQ